jgi:hypothetical protein
VPERAVLLYVVRLGSLVAFVNELILRGTRPIVGQLTFSYDDFGSLLINREPTLH